VVRRPPVVGKAFSSFSASVTLDDAFPNATIFPEFVVASFSLAVASFFSAAAFAAA
jgi:hypothetical protein